MVRVVGCDRETVLPGLEQLVPVHARETAPDLELAAAVVDLDPGDVVRQLEAPRDRAGPVRMREVGDAAVLLDPGAGALEICGLGRELAGIGVDPEREHVAVASVGEDAVELGARDHQQAVRLRLRALPVVGDREHVVAGARVVGGERLGLELPVRARGVGVQRTAKPLTLGCEGIDAFLSHGGEDPTTGP